MKVYTMGFTQKTAEQFFKKIRDNQIELLIDVRLNNKSQLAGFTKGEDLEFFLKELCNCKYVHETKFSPTKELLDDYKKGRASWDEYVSVFSDIMATRNVADYFNEKYTGYERVLLLCSEPTPEQCHRRLLAEEFEKKIGVDVIHI